MASSIRQVTPDRLQIREGGGVISVFGLPFFAAGLFLLATVLRIVPVGNAGSLPGYAWPLMALMALLFTAVGGTLVFGRSWTTLDIGRRSVTKQWGLLVPFRQRTFPIDRYSGVRLGFVEGDSDSADRFPVELKAKSGANLPVCHFTTYGESRACAAAVAQHLRLDLEDASTDHPIRLSGSQADRSFQDALWRERKPREATSRPPDARSDVSTEADTTRIVIPRPRAHPLTLARADPVGHSRDRPSPTQSVLPANADTGCDRVDLPLIRHVFFRCPASDVGRKRVSQIPARRPHRVGVATRHPYSGTRRVENPHHRDTRRGRHS